MKMHLPRVAGGSLRPTIPMALGAKVENICGV
jgi:hypothetical protein